MYVWICTLHCLGYISPEGFVLQDVVLHMCVHCAGYTSIGDWDYACVLIEYAFCEVVVIMILSVRIWCCVHVCIALDIPALVNDGWHSCKVLCRPAALGGKDYLRSSLWVVSHHHAATTFGFIVYIAWDKSLGVIHVCIALDILALDNDG